MFSMATRNFVQEIDENFSLIPVRSLNDTDKLLPLSLVFKRKRFWTWQKPKYLPTDFTLNDVLSEDPPLTPVIIETNFLNYKGTFGNNTSNNLKAEAGVGNINIEGKDTSKLQSSFGSLKKEEVDMQKLLRDSKHKLLDMSHSLIQQTHEKRKVVFGLVKERIMTTQPCSVIEEVHEGIQLGGLLTFCVKSPQVTIKENTTLHKDNNVSLEIPAHTVIAYSIADLVVKRKGDYELCLLSDTLGGFEVDGPCLKDSVGVFGSCGDASKSSCLQRELEKLCDHFQLLSVQPTETRSSLLKFLRNTMKNREEVSVLESVLDQLCRGRTTDLGDANSETVQAVLDLMKPSDDLGQNPTPAPSLLSATLLITSAMEEMTDEGLSVLASCCSPPVLEALQILVQCVAAGSGETLSLTDAGLTVLTEEEVYGRAQCFFDLSNVILKREEDTLKTEIKDQPGHLPLVMSIAVKGLASLVTTA